MILDQTLGIVLAGGQSRRFGSQKAFARLEGISFYEWSYRCLSEVADQVLIVTQPELVSSFRKSYNCIVDHPSVKGCGPLAGIYSAMDAIASDRYLVLPCDLPFMKPVLLRELLKQLRNEQYLGFRIGDKEHPLVSVWRYSAKPVIYNQLMNRNYRVTDTITQLNGRYVDAIELGDDAERYLMNVNSRDVLERMGYHATTDC